MRSFDVAVIGAGPVGSTAAFTTSKAGFRTLLVEEHSAIGRPAHCTGKLSCEAFGEFSLPKQIILTAVRGATFYSPQLKTCTVSKKTPESYIVDRVAFDQFIAQRAIEAGASLLLGAKVCAVGSYTNGYRRLRIRRKDGWVEVDARIVINAEGAGQHLVPSLGISRLKTLMGLQYELDGCSLESTEYVEVYFGRKYAPGFFAWLVPTGEASAKVGLCTSEQLTSNSVRKTLDNLIRTHPSVIQKVGRARLKGVFGGRVPLHGPVSRTYDDAILIVGDAAGHNKSTSGGGIYFGMKAARHAGNVASLSLQEGKYMRKDLAAYETLWNKDFGKELRFTSMGRRILDTLSDNDLEKLIDFFAHDESLIRTVESDVTTSYQSAVWNPTISRIARAALTRPRNFKLFAKVVCLGLLSLYK